MLSLCYPSNGVTKAIRKFHVLRLHIGLLLLCITYIVAGSAIFYHIEKPEEIRRRNEMLGWLEKEQKIFVNALIGLIKSENSFESFNTSILDALDGYERSIFEMFDRSVSVTVFDSAETPEMWTASSAVMFAATTMIPIGFGIVTPVTSFGRIVLMGFAVTGIPLAVATLADLGKFLCYFFCHRIKDKSLLSATIVFTSFFVYPALGGIAICCMTPLDFFDSLYYCIMTILMIGYGDFSPSIPLIFLLLFIVFGVMLVTVSIDAVGADIINHIHFMGRQMGKARAIAEKVYLMAQKMSVNRGLGAGVAQLNAFARFTITMGARPSLPVRRSSSVYEEESCQKLCSFTEACKKGAFEPSVSLEYVDNFDFADSLSSDTSEKISLRNETTVAEVV